VADICAGSGAVTKHSITVIQNDFTHYLQKQDEIRHVPELVRPSPSRVIAATLGRRGRNFHARKFNPPVDHRRLMVEWLMLCCGRCSSAFHRHHSARWPHGVGAVPERYCTPVRGRRTGRSPLAAVFFADAQQQRSVPRCGRVPLRWELTRANAATADEILNSYYDPLPKPHPAAGEFVDVSYYLSAGVK
jgi:hypothetical protein